MCPVKPFKTVARSCILLFYIPLENIEASEDFQVLRKKIPSFCSPLYGCGSLQWVWFELRDMPGQESLMLWCLWGAQPSFMRISTNSSSLERRPHRPPGRGKNHRKIAHSVLLQLIWGFIWGAFGFGEIICLYMPQWLFLSCGLGVGNLSCVLCRVPVISLVFSLL